MTRQTVLVVDDEDELRELLCHVLQKGGYETVDVGTGEEALVAATSRPLDLVLLDLMLPGVDGLTVCQRLKSDPRTRRLPVVLLTVKNEESSILKAFAAGADDYITKPFSPKVLLARTRAVLRRSETAAANAPDTERHASDADDAIGVGELVIDHRRCEARVAGASIDLSRTEFRILELLAQRAGWVFSRTQIIRGVHGHENVVTHRAVDVQIVGLRRKLGPAGAYIETVRGFGYRLVAPEEGRAAQRDANEDLTESPQPANGAQV